MVRIDILISAFEPFGVDDINPTQLVLKDLPEEIAGCNIHKLLLPVEFKKAPKIASTEFLKIKPSILIMLGQAGGRDNISIESKAINLMNAPTLGDNADYKPQNEPIIFDGPKYLDTTLPIEKIVEAINKESIPSKISNDAGTYVCNALLYQMLYLNKEKIPMGFIHVPYIKEQGHLDKPYLELEKITKAIIIAIETTIKELKKD